LLRTFVNTACASGQACKLHIASHAGLPNPATGGMPFYQYAGYNRRADTNNMIVLYPQTIATTANPAGWGNGVAPMT
jgi:poly(3-hydroxybutyrate) depolymerase